MARRRSGRSLSRRGSKRSSTRSRRIGKINRRRSGGGNWHEGYRGPQVGYSNASRPNTNSVWVKAKPTVMQTPSTAAATRRLSNTASKRDREVAALERMLQRNQADKAQRERAELDKRLKAEKKKQFWGNIFGKNTQRKKVTSPLRRTSSSNFTIKSALQTPRVHATPIVSPRTIADIEAISIQPRGVTVKSGKTPAAKTPQKTSWLNRSLRFFKPSKKKTRTDIEHLLA